MKTNDLSGYDVSRLKPPASLSMKLSRTVCRQGESRFLPRGTCKQASAKSKKPSESVFASRIPPRPWRRVVKEIYLALGDPELEIEVTRSRLKIQSD